MTVILKKNVNKETAINIMKAINRITLAENLSRGNGHWLFSIKSKKEIPTMSVWLQLFLDKYIKNIELKEK